MDEIIIGIIGGTGSMGRWFEAYFKKEGCRVLISGRKTELTNADLAARCNVVIISTPIDAAVTIAKEVGPLMKKEQLLMDFCSLKEDIVQSMLASTEAEVIGTHPMFGPFTDDIRGQNVILCPARCGRWKNWLENILRKRGAVVSCLDPVTHDKHMALAQGLTHFLSVCMGKTLQTMNIIPEEAMQYSTPIFRLNLDLIGRLFSQDLDLYAMLIGQNKYVAEALETFTAAMNESQKMLLSGKKTDSVSYMKDIREFLGDFCQKGLEESSHALQAILGNEKK